MARIEPLAAAGFEVIVPTGAGSVLPTVAPAGRFREAPHALVSAARAFCRDLLS